MNPGLQIRVFIAAFAVLLLAGCGSRARNGEAGEDHAFLERLEGNYSMKMEDATRTNYSTAVVSETARGQYSIARVTVYGPVYYGFTLTEEDGMVLVNSRELGQGSVSYNPVLDKISIRFEKEEFICELSK